MSRRKFPADELAPRRESKALAVRAERDGEYIDTLLAGVVRWVAQNPDAAAALVVGLSLLRESMRKRER